MRSMVEGGHTTGQIKRHSSAVHVSGKPAAGQGSNVAMPRDRSASSNIETTQIARFPSLFPHLSPPPRVGR
jgi:uncharacterized Zn-binding protein involved in type VI secretion